ncbi:hypothetical protein DPMN_173658 [Dreissena polymorpha]|uniref:Uncharacterized protein n=1 Tax=Dreissena polymorpha TaxID=45954 RepID=A0A9D4E5H8_DREPO|nr:hypothetical protein DPMN_173658 [Dreissena polymorpha]
MSIPDISYQNKWLLTDDCNIDNLVMRKMLLIMVMAIRILNYDNDDDDDDEDYDDYENYDTLTKSGFTSHNL